MELPKDFPTAAEIRRDVQRWRSWRHEEDRPNTFEAIADDFVRSRLRASVLTFAPPPSERKIARLRALTIQRLTS